MEKLEAIAAEIQGLTLLEAAELVKVLESRLGVSAAQQATAQRVEVPAEPVKVEQTEFDVILVSSGEKKIEVLKALRQATSMALKEAKDFVDQLPKLLKQGISKDEAEALRLALTEKGATVEVR